MLTQRVERTEFFPCSTSNPEENRYIILGFGSVIMHSQAESTMFDDLHRNAATHKVESCGIPQVAGQALTHQVIPNQLKERLDGHQSK